MATTNFTPIKSRVIKTRKQLIETERNTRKLAQQKRDERKDAFLLAQKQLLKTTEYIDQLDELSHQLTSNIEETYQLLKNTNAPIKNMTHHFSQNINEFSIKQDHDINKATLVSSDIAYASYDIDALIESFDDINAGHKDYNEAYLMNNIDAPFLSTFNDMPLFTDKIQSCLYSSCIYIDHKARQKATQRYRSDSKYTDLSFENDHKENEDIAMDLDAYDSYLNAREILIEQLLRFMLVYPSQQKEKQSVTEYYQEILPFCLYSLIIILYQSSTYMEVDIDMENNDVYPLFGAFIKRSRQQIEQNVVQSLQIVKDNPSLLIACLNKYSELVSYTNKKKKHDYSSTLTPDISTLQLRWNPLFRTLSASHAKKDSKCIDFMSKYLFHSSFYQCFDTLSRIVCDSLAINFKLLFAKLSTNNNKEKKEIEEKKSFNDIMSSIQDNLCAILTLDHHETLLQSPLLSTYLDENITPFIQTSTKKTISHFISTLESHLNRTNDVYQQNKHTSFSLDEEYLEIGVCCEKLETFIMNVIEQYIDKSKENITTPISASLMQMVSCIASLKLRALKYWSSAMSRKLFTDVSSRLENKLTFWNIYESYYTKTVWKSIIIEGDNDDDDNDDEVMINIPCQASEYIHDICFQFIQILLMIITQPHVPNTIINVLENEFRFSISQQLNNIFTSFLSTHNPQTNKISESFGLQLYFDVSFARAILTTMDASSLWNDILSVVTDEYIELVTMEYAIKYLENEIQKSVNNCLLIYGVHSSSFSKYINKEENKTGACKKIKTKTVHGGNIFAKPIKKMKRIALLPVASYQISQSANENLNNSPMRMGLLNHSTLLDDANVFSPDINQKDKIADSFNQFTSGAMSHANTLFKNFGSMFQ